ncbi:gliding motility-associated C-terminal domain-containing protein [Mucilaginibacter sp.]|uniref:gliding motility-associated C-terminal domain-containing protein n=1 Tax=Mucilaginibacter sp. TaxID=1882438 RepID=UPI002627CE2A|nr:gliding motility-associated C-terminal domain-containing protein [Mucilaginibacter sp.]MDB4920895.1 Gliding motility-associated C-terminal protein [Mucilaginibacter sp.]
MFTQIFKHSKSGGKLLLFILFLFLHTKTYSQQFYAATSSGQLQLVTLTANGLVSVTVPGCYSYFSIAIFTNKIYFSDANGNLFSGNLTGSPVSVTNCQLISTGVYANSMTVDKQGVIYYAIYNQLYMIDPNSPSPAPVFLGSMSYSATGDLAFFQNELYMASDRGIVQVKLKDPSKSTLYIPYTAQYIYGLTNVAVNGNDVLFALSLSGNSTNLIELDMQNKIVKGNAGSLPYNVYDAGSVTEAGEVPSIEITDTRITQECDVFNKARVEIITKQHTSKYTFTLDNGQTNLTGIFDNLAPGVHPLTITSDGEEFPKHTSFTVPDFTLTAPLITPSLKNPICDILGEIKLDAGVNNSTYTIKYNGNSFSFDHAFSGLAAGTYHFIILNAQDCIVNEKDYALQQDICPPITVNDVQVARECDVFGKAKVTITTQAHPDNYIYTLNNTSNATGIFDLVPPGAYNLVIISSGGDRVVRPVTVPDYTLDIPNITYAVKNADCTLFGEIKFKINGDTKGATSIRYGSQVYPIDQAIKTLPPGANSFSVLNQQGCVIDIINVDVALDPCKPIVFPNAFTPNGDGVNDIFRSNQDADPLKFQLLIYNRWGALIFKSQSIFNGWDGTFNGKPVPFGVFYWVASYITIDGKDVAQSGYVTLIK